MDVKKLQKIYGELNQFDDFLGLSLDILQAGHILYELEIEKKHLSSPDTCHGGALAAMMDAVIGMSALSYSVTQKKLCSTVEFKINYLNPAHLGDQLKGEGKIDFTGKTYIVSTGEIRNQKNDLVAKAIGTFNLYPLDKKNYFKLDV